MWKSRYFKFTDKHVWLFSTATDCTVTEAQVFCTNNSQKISQKIMVLNKTKCPCRRYVQRCLTLPVKVLWWVCVRVHLCCGTYLWWQLRMKETAAWCWWGWGGRDILLSAQAIRAGMPRFWAYRKRSRCLWYAVGWQGSCWVQGTLMGTWLTVLGCTGDAPRLSTFHRTVGHNQHKEAF